MSANSYRTRRRFVEAIQWSGFNQAKLARFLGCSIAEIEPGPYKETAKIPGTNLVATPNDFVVREAGRLRVFTPELFHDVYEPHDPVADGNSLED